MLLFGPCDSTQFQGPYYWFYAGGRVEHQLPVLNIIIPRWMERLYPQRTKHLEVNQVQWPLFIDLTRTQHRLVTSFNVYQTLLHLLYFPELPPRSSRQAQFSGRVPPATQLSLFDEIPFTTSCTDAGIPLAHCTCGRQFLLSHLIAYSPYFIVLATLLCLCLRRQ